MLPNQAANHQMVKKEKKKEEQLIIFTHLRGNLHSIFAFGTLIFKILNDLLSSFLQIVHVPVQQH